MSAPSPHSGKFRAAVALLLGIAIGAVAVAAAVLATGHHRSPPSARWSEWSPPDDGVQGARDIAEFVAPHYRITATDQLAVVTVVNLASAAAVAAAQSGTSTSPTIGLLVAVRPDPRSSQISLLTGNTIAYNLCGVGSNNCSIGIGTPSSARLLLIRREALELAMYTLRYISGAQNVVVILPPGVTQAQSTLTPRAPAPGQVGKQTHVDMAVLFIRAELQPFLGMPLSATLPEEFPPSVQEMSSAPEAGLVDQITARGLFSEKIVQAQDGSSLLMLNPLPPQ